MSHILGVLRHLGHNPKPCVKHLQPLLDSFKTNTKHVVFPFHLIHKQITSMIIPKKNVLSSKSHLEEPLTTQFSSGKDHFVSACRAFRYKDVKAGYDATNLAYRFAAFPKVPVVLPFWDEKEGFEADVIFLFHKTVILHWTLNPSCF